MTNSAPETEQGESHAFGADVSRLLDILVHSVYADREVFLRELVSNAADACDKLRYEAITEPALLGDDAELKITVTADREAGTLTIADNGIGMSRDELGENLGTIAKSGTRAFMEAASAKGIDGGSLIGQFGIGFYSAFIVADTISVFSTRAGKDDPWVWSSSGEGRFTITPADPNAAPPPRGTRVVLTLREGLDDYLDPIRIEGIIRTHSDHVPFPIDVIEIKDGATGEPKRANTASALWTRPKSEITEEQYREFYGAIGGLFDEPAHTIHYKAEGRHEYDVLLFIPSKRPFDLFDPSRTAKVKLYVRRVLITDDAAILPPYLRFVRGIVDSADMPLTVSRDMLQDNLVAQAIRKAVTNRILSTLKKQAEKEPDAFAELWDTFGAVIKEGLYEDYERRDELLDLVRFRSTASDGLRSLKDYVADLKDEQTAIYFLTGEDLDHLARSPLLEGFRARGIEVLLLTDPVDNFWTQGVSGYDGKPLKSIAQGADDLKSIPLPEGESEESEDTPRAADGATAVAFVRQALGDKVSDVRLTDRLVESPACLVTADGAVDRGLERMLREREGGSRTAPVLELNPRHELISALAEAAKSGGGDQAEAAAHLLLDCALIADGEAPADPHGFGSRVQNLMKSALGG